MDTLTVDDLRLTLCTPDNGPHFDMGEFLTDHLPDDDHGRDGLPGTREEREAIEAAVNDFVAKYAPLCWNSTGVVADPASLLPDTHKEAT